MIKVITFKAIIKNQTNVCEPSSKNNLKIFSKTIDMD
jgi:hypothetical protein